MTIKLSSVNYEDSEYYKKYLSEINKYKEAKKPTPLLDITYYLHGEVKRVIT